MGSYSIADSPRREIRPFIQLGIRPRNRLVGMAGRAWIRDLVLVAHGRSDELEGVRADKSARNALGLNLWHVARHTLTSGAARLVACVLFNTCRMRAIWRSGPVAIKA